MFKPRLYSIEKEVQNMGYANIPPEIFSSSDPENLMQNISTWIMEISRNHDISRDTQYVIKRLVQTLPNSEDILENLFKFSKRIYEHPNILLSNKEELLKLILLKFPKNFKNWKKHNKIKKYLHHSSGITHLFDSWGKISSDKNEQRRIGKIMKDSDKLRKKYPKEFFPQFSYANCLFLKEKNAEALKEYEKSLEIARDNYEKGRVINNLTICYSSQNRFDDAVALLESNLDNPFIEINAKNNEPFMQSVQQLEKYSGKTFLKTEN